MAAERSFNPETRADRYVVLLAEDEPIIRMDIADALRQLDCQVIETGTAEEAIGMLRSAARIDVVLTDVRMPGHLNGLDLASAVRQLRPGVKIVVMSGHLSSTDEHEHLIDFFVSKPVPSDQLARTIVKLVNNDPEKRNG